MEPSRSPLPAAAGAGKRSEFAVYRVASALHVMAVVTRRRRNSRTIPEHASPRLVDDLEAYGVISEIARGGTSTVYLGRDLATGERVAIKALDAFYVGHSEMVHRLLAEHELAQRARHPGLLEIRCADQTRNGIPYVVMEYLDGENLGARLHRSAVSLGSIFALAAQAARAVCALHAAGVVHCDLKPDNLFVLHEPGPGGWPQVKVIDYGVARLADEPPSSQAVVAGTPAFMAPEQWHGAPTTKSDVYALGCMLYELVTGAPLFSGALPQLMAAHCERSPERPSLRRPELTPELDRLILRALAKDPGSRPTMSEVATELTAVFPLATVAGVTARPLSPCPPAAATCGVPGRMRDTFGELPEGLARRLQALG
jgi:serine/threonine-protein kinase